MLSTKHVPSLVPHKAFNPNSYVQKVLPFILIYVYLLPTYDTIGTRRGLLSKGA